MSSVQQEFSEGQLKELKELKELQELQELEGLQELEELQELQEDSLIQEEEDLLEDLAAFNAELESADVKPSISSVASSETSSLFLKKKDEITLEEKQSFSSNETTPTETVQTKCEKLNETTEINLVESLLQKSNNDDSDAADTTCSEDDKEVLINPEKNMVEVTLQLDDINQTLFENVHQIKRNPKLSTFLRMRK